MTSYIGVPMLVFTGSWGEIWVMYQLLYRIYSTLFIEETVAESLTSSASFSAGIIKFKIILTLYFTNYISKWQEQLDK
jgi:hypothetical protein